MLKSVILGLLLGLFLSSISYILVIRLTKNGLANSTKNKKTLSYLYLCSVIKLLVLFMVRGNIPMLLATAIGLTSTKNVVFIKYSFKHIFGKKGVNE